VLTPPGRGQLVLLTSGGPPRRCRILRAKRHYGDCRVARPVLVGAVLMGRMVFVRGWP